jgi:menaquinone-dependent protoporphyrinogen oxidase
MDSILVVYGTKHGSAREVAEAVAASLRDLGQAAEARPALQVDDISPYSGVVAGGSIYMGRWHADVLRFLHRFETKLAVMPVAVFGIGPRTLSEHDVAQSREQVERGLDATPEIAPFSLLVVGGVVDPKKLHWPFNHLRPSDARDWTAIRAWTEELADTFAYGKTAAEAGDPRTELQQTHR